jgi:hypothetical protein
VTGTVEDAESDGRGGWFLLGEISAVGGVEVPEGQVVHVLPSGRLDPSWRLRSDGDVYALARVASTLYVGGSFSRLAGVRRDGLFHRRCPLGKHPGLEAARLGTHQERQRRGLRDHADA